MHVSPRPRARGRRPGVALLIALVAMSLVGALIAGLLLAAMRERRDGGDAIRRVRALAAAEYGPAMLLASGEWPAAWTAAPVRGFVGARVLHPGDGSVDSVTVLRLGLSTFLVASRGIVGIGVLQARRRIGVLVDLRPPSLEPRAALTAAGGVRLGAGSSADGGNAAPPGWECAPGDSGPAIAAVAVTPPAAVDTIACGTDGCLRGGAPIVRDSAVADPAWWERSGEVDRAALLAVSRRLPAGSTIGDAAPSLDAVGGCDTTNQRNLGDPRRSLGAESPCAGWFPVLHAAGDLHLSGGAGEGVMLVDGDLHLERGVTFAGIAIVRGALYSSGGASLAGAAIAARASLDAGSSIHYSRCAIAAALVRIARPAPAARWGWLELY